MIYQFRLLVLIGTYLIITTAEQQCVCPQEKDEVCGSDGKTYDNLCLLKCEQAIKPSLTSLGHGGCKEITPGCFCPYGGVPICTTNNVIYSNECEFKCQQAVNPSLRIRNKGKCRKRRQVNNQDGLIWGTYTSKRWSETTKRSSETRWRGLTVPISAVVPVPCDCPPSMAAVCGSDGVIYDNECLLQCASRNKPDLRVQHSEPCININNGTEDQQQRSTSQQ